MMGRVIAVLLAITMAIFPISMPRAAMPGGHHHAAALEGDHGTADGVSAMHHHVSDDGDCRDHFGGLHDGSGAPCCGMGACHAFEMAVAPDVSSPVTAAVPLAIVADGQVDGTIPGRLDRPPRTV
ncbi:hypothetical protein [Microvirga massiliensis]|uniref:hypothetical protein n=1 Tax=Microvirga massiliensis TaxID=1033741 RepID=UPI00062B30F1|nr:hypothetical protein [Microvirga massiliensis]